MTSERAREKEGKNRDRMNWFFLFILVVRIEESFENKRKKKRNTLNKLDAGLYKRYGKKKME